MISNKKIIKALKKAKSKDEKTPAILTLALTEKVSRHNRFSARSKIGDSLPLSKVLNVLQDAKTSGAVHLNITGDGLAAEPLVREDINIILEKAIDLDYEITLWTNGDLVEQKIESLMRISSAVIYLDGTQKFHDNIRGKGSFSYAVGAARLLVMRGIPTSFYTLLYKDSILELDGIMEAAQRVGVEVAFAPATKGLMNSVNQPDMVEHFPQYRKTIDALIDRKTKLLPVANSISALKHLREWPDKLKLKKCPWRYVHCYIDSHARLSMCHEKPWPKQPFENIIKNSFSKAFDVLEPPPCLDCWGAYRAQMYAEAQKISFLWNFKSLKEIG